MITNEELAVRVGQVWRGRHALSKGITSEWVVRYVGRTTVVLEGNRGTEIAVRPQVVLSEYQLVRPMIFPEPVWFEEFVSSVSHNSWWAVRDSETALETAWDRTGRRVLMQEVETP